MHGTEPKLLKLQDPEKEIGSLTLWKGENHWEKKTKPPQKLSMQKACCPKIITVNSNIQHCHFTQQVKRRIDQLWTTHLPVTACMYHMVYNWWSCCLRNCIHLFIRSINWFLGKGEAPPGYCILSKKKKVLEVLNLLLSVSAMQTKLKNARQVLNDPSSLEKKKESNLGCSFGKYMIVQQTF